ncbi:MAG: hypothetical protein U0136_21275 [Bdellovibrionota bacterium]
MTIDTASKRKWTLGIFFVVLLAYVVSAGSLLLRQSATPQYVHLAWAFLHGHVDLITQLPNNWDLIRFENRWYVPGEVMPAILVMPFVAIFGTGLSDILFGVIVGALNAALLFSLLTRIARSPVTAAWLALLFGVGTVHWYVSVIGGVWMSAHITAVLFMILYARAAMDGHAWRSGFFLSCASLSRPPTLFAAIFFVVIVFLDEPMQRARTEKLAKFGTALLAAVGVMLTYNFLRFGSFVDFGYTYVQGNATLVGAYRAGGGFNWKYVPCHVYISLFALPNFGGLPDPKIGIFCGHLPGLRNHFEGVWSFFNPMGMSMFLTTPAFLLVFRKKPSSAIVAASWLGLLAVLDVDWLYHTTGWVQFGYRYCLDYIVFIFILLAYAVPRIRVLESALMLVSMALALAGMLTMRSNFYGWSW